MSRVHLQEEISATNASEQTVQYPFDCSFIAYHYHHRILLGHLHLKWFSRFIREHWYQDIWYSTNMKCRKHKQKSPMQEIISSPQEKAWTSDMLDGHLSSQNQRYLSPYTAKSLWQDKSTCEKKAVGNFRSYPLRLTPLTSSLKETTEDMVRFFPAAFPIPQLPSP